VTFDLRQGSEIDIDLHRVDLLAVVVDFRVVDV
jgi:hypothetical protein